MRIFCFYCGKCVSTELPDDTIVRAINVCPECIPIIIRDDFPELTKENKK